jgi:hypothetical protein
VLLLFEDDFVTLMTGKFANKSGPITPSIAGYLENRRIRGVFFTSRRNRRRQVADSHQVVHRGGEGEHKVHPVLTSVPGLPEIPHGFLQPKISSTLFRRR